MQISEQRKVRIFERQHVEREVLKFKQRRVYIWVVGCDYSSSGESNFKVENRKIGGLSCWLLWHFIEEGGGFVGRDAFLKRNSKRAG